MVEIVAQRPMVMRTTEDGHEERVRIGRLAHAARGRRPVAYPAHGGLRRVSYLPPGGTFFARTEFYLVGGKISFPFWEGEKAHHWTVYFVALMDPSWDNSLWNLYSLSL